MSWKTIIALGLLMPAFLSCALAADKKDSLYDKSLPQELKEKGELIQEIAQKESALLPDLTRREIGNTIEQFRSRETRDKAYQSLLRQTNEIVIMCIDRYFTESDIEVKRDMIGLLAAKSKKENYLTILAVLKRECFSVEDRLRVGAINAVAAVIRSGRGARQREGWIDNGEMESCLILLRDIAGAANTQYTYWQRAAGQQLISLGRPDLVPEDMRRQLESGPEI